MGELSDRELVEGYLSGRPELFDELVHRYLPLIYNFVWYLSGHSVDTPDIVQDIFIKIWRKIGTFDREQKFKTWTYVIARRTVIDWFRKKKDKTFSSIAGPDDPSPEDSLADSAPLQDETFARQEERDKLRELIDRLPKKYSEVVYLKYDEEMTFEEISLVLDIPLNTVKSQYRRALFRLRESLENAPRDDQSS